LQVAGPVRVCFAKVIKTMLTDNSYIPELKNSCKTKGAGKPAPIGKAPENLLLTNSNVHTI